MSGLRRDKNLIEIELKLNEVMDLCEEEHKEKTALKAENYDLKKELDQALDELNRKITQLEQKNSIGENSELQGLTSEQRMFLSKLKDVKEDVLEFSKKVDSVAYSMDIRNRKNK